MTPIFVVLRKRTFNRIKLKEYLIEINTDDGEEHSTHAIDIVIYYRAKFYNILDTVIVNFKQRLLKDIMNLLMVLASF